MPIRLADICTREAPHQARLWYSMKACSKSPSATSHSVARLMDILIGHRRALRQVLQHQVRRSPSSATGPCVQSARGSRKRSIQRLNSFGHAHDAHRLVAVVAKYGSTSEGGARLVVAARGMLADDGRHQLKSFQPRTGSGRCDVLCPAQERRAQRRSSASHPL